ncbi:MAG: aminoglycoside phosphotransferase family protein [Clostridiales bacterium]|nr:aminoglycoside phosphotransferase family protein [Clostridiales bacterium]
MSLIKKELPSTIDEILDAYSLNRNIIEWKLIDNGHINRTFYIYCETAGGKREKRLLQQINTEVFKNPLELMDNVVRVTAFLRDKITAQGGDPNRETLSVYFTRSGQSCFVDSEGSYWRFYNFIDNAFSYNAIENDSVFYDAGRAFGNFQSQLADFPIDTLYDIIPDFHDTHKRLLQLKEAESRNTANRADSVRDELRFAYDREKDTSVLVDLLQKGELPLRVTHNDTKLNNIMFDRDTGKAVCIVDLDTVMPGLSLYDFGDAIRFGANTGAEDEKDLSKISLDLNLYEKYVCGYLSAAGKSLTAKEIEYLPFSAKLLTLECGMRFLADYLNGDVYFGTSYPEHNLDRCRTQFKLVADMEKKFGEMTAITAKAAEKI